MLGFGIVGGNALAPEPPRAPTPEVDTATVTRIAVAGDTGAGPGSAIDTGAGPGSAIEATVKSMVDQGRRRHYDGLVLLGDLVYPEGDADLAASRITDAFEPIVRNGARLVPVLGNHDYMSDEQFAILAEAGRERTWYVDRVGFARILVLDTEQVDNPAQTSWLRKTLASPTDAAWTIVTMHKPAYSAGVHGSDEEIQQQWAPLFELYDVPLVLAGHDHDYQRSKPINGVTYVVSGGAAALRPTGHEDFTQVSTSTLH